MLKGLTVFSKKRKRIVLKLVKEVYKPPMEM